MALIINMDGPPRRTAKLEPACEFCGERCTGSGVGDWRQVIGWVQTRQGGGAHSITSHEPTGRSACDGCMALLRRGIDPRQPTAQEPML